MKEQSLGHAAVDHPLEGWTVAVKANIDVVGVTTDAGSRILSDGEPATQDAPVVARLRRAGVEHTTRAGMHEFAFGVTGENAFDQVRHPLDPTRVPGGSSSGSAAAVAAGGARLGVGTDTGGSVRIPAALCGVVGLKLAYDRALLAGIVPLSPTLDHVGFMTRTVDDMAVVAGLFGAESGGDAAADLAFNVVRDAEADPVVTSALDGLVRRLRGVVPVVDDSDVSRYDVDFVHAMTNTIMFYEAAEVHREWMTHRPDDYGEDVLARLRSGADIGHTAYAKALRQRKQFERWAVRAFADGTVLIEPTVRDQAPTRSEAADPAVAGRLVKRTRLANAARLPALTIPVPGAPYAMGVQITAGDVTGVLAAARIVEAALR